MRFRHIPAAALTDRSQHTITLTLPMQMHKEVIELVEAGHYSTMAEFYRAAARSLLDSWYRHER